MGDYNFGPGPKGWAAIFVLVVIGALATCIGAAVLIGYVVSHLRWI